MKTATSHNFSTDDSIARSSERSFGFVFAIVFLLIAIYPLIQADSIRWWALTLALVFLLTAFLLPIVLYPLNYIWYRFGLLLHHIVNPLVMGLVFFTTIIPIGIIMQISGKDILNLKLKSSAKSYWINRYPPGPSKDSLKKQY